MADLAVRHDIDDKTLFSLVSDGDCRKLNDAQKLAYYKARCDAAGLDYRAQPFQYISLNGKLVLYALKACTDQLSAKHGIRCEILDQRTEEGIRVVTVRAISKDGRQTDEIGAVNVKGLQGDALCNALMKAATKAKRRAILAVCGLGMLDESEMDTIPSAAPQPVVQMPKRLSEKSLKPLTPEVMAESDALVAASREVNGTTDLDADDTLALLERSVAEVNARADEIEENEPPVEYISESQRRHLLGLANENKHGHAQVKAWLARRGVSSSKEITTAMYDRVRARLADPTPLES